MAAQPECRRCGDYVHSGLVVCEECSGILKDEMEALRAELTDATAQVLRLNEENKRLHDALTKLQARYDETEAAAFQHLREKEAALAALEAARELGSITYQLQDELNAMSLELENKVTNDGWASIAVRNGLRVFVNVNTNEVSYKIATDKKRRSFNNYQGALNFLSEIKDGE